MVSSEKFIPFQLSFLPYSQWYACREMNKSRTEHFYAFILALEKVGRKIASRIRSNSVYLFNEHSIEAVVASEG